MNYIAIPGLKFKAHRMPPGSLKFITCNKIVDVVCAYFNYSVDDLKVRKRVRPLCYARQVCMYFLIKDSSLTLTEIGKLFAMDHTTVIHARETIKDLLSNDQRIRNDIGNINDLIQ